MKMTPEEYLFLLERRGALSVTDEEKELIRNRRLGERSGWSSYIHYIKPLRTSGTVEAQTVAKAAYDLAIELKAGDIELDEFTRRVKQLRLSVDGQLAYMVDQIIKLHDKEPEPDLDIDTTL